jgi:hypothetical protein
MSAEGAALRRGVSKSRRDSLTAIYWLAKRAVDSDMVSTFVLGQTVVLRGRLPAIVVPPARPGRGRPAPARSRWVSDCWTLLARPAPPSAWLRNGQRPRLRFPIELPNDLRLISPTPRPIRVAGSRIRRRPRHAVGAGGRESCGEDDLESGVPAWSWFVDARGRSWTVSAPGMGGGGNPRDRWRRSRRSRTAIRRCGRNCREQPG